MAQDWPLEGPGSAVHLGEHRGKHGSLPSGFFDRWCRSKEVEESDMMHHEVGALVDGLEVGGVHAQTNRISLAMGEVLTKRLQTIFDAMEQNAMKTTLESANFFGGSGVTTDAVPPRAA